MKRAPLKYLVYREFYMIKKNALIFGATFLGMAAIGILVQLSMEIGNLSKISPDIMEMLQEALHFFIIYMPVLAASMMFGSVCEGAIKEVDPMWKRFRLSTPVSQWRFVLAKYISITILFGVSLMLSLFYTGIIFVIKNEKMTISDISLTIVLLLVFLLFENVMQVLIILFRSMDKALLVSMGIVFITIWIIFLKLGDKLVLIMEENTIIPMKAIEAWCMSILPYTPVILIIIMMVGFVATALLYKRRER